MVRTADPIPVCAVRVDLAAKDLGDHINFGSSRQQQPSELRGVNVEVVFANLDVSMVTVCLHLILSYQHARAGRETEIGRNAFGVSLHPEFPEASQSWIDRFAF